MLGQVSNFRRQFLEVMDDDFNTGGEIGVLFDLVRNFNKYIDDQKLEDPAKPEPSKIPALKQGRNAPRAGCDARVVPLQRRSRPLLETD